MVGAILVSSVATVWDGLAIPPYASSIRRKSFAGQNIALERFAEMAPFQHGLHGDHVCCLPEGPGTLDALQPLQAVLVGQRHQVAIETTAAPGLPAGKPRRASFC